MGPLTCEQIFVQFLMFGCCRDKLHRWYASRHRRRDSEETPLLNSSSSEMSNVSIHQFLCCCESCPSPSPPPPRLQKKQSHTLTNWCCMYTSTIIFIHYYFTACKLHPLFFLKQEYLIFIMHSFFLNHNSLKCIVNNYYYFNTLLQLCNALTYESHNSTSDTTALAQHWVMRVRQA